MSKKDDTRKKAMIKNFFQVGILMVGYGYEDEIVTDDSEYKNILEEDIMSKLDCDDVELLSSSTYVYLDNGKGDYDYDRCIEYVPDGDD